MAKEFGLNALHLEALGESCQWEIVVGGDILERLVEIQCQFKRLAVMGDDEYRGFSVASCYGPEAYQVHHHEPLRVC